MCGIGLLVYGIRVNLSVLRSDNAAPSVDVKPVVFTADELVRGLRRRGPDGFGCTKIILQWKNSGLIENSRVNYILAEKEETESGKVKFEYYDKSYGHIDSTTGSCKNKVIGERCTLQLHFLCATLQLRGIIHVAQPIEDALGNILIYNGEVFGGVNVDASSSDTQVLLQSLAECCCCGTREHICSCYPDAKRKYSVPELLSTIRGPWALVYWQNSSKTLWFGRDAFGRRSLLVHWPSSEDSRFLMSSVSPGHLANNCYAEDERCLDNIDFWEELPCGIYSICFGIQEMDNFFTCKLRKHEWTESLLKKLITWDRFSIKPRAMRHDTASRFSIEVCHEVGFYTPAQKVLAALRKSMKKRSVLQTHHKVTSLDMQGEHVPFAVLFSGGLDSMVIAALLDECLDPSCGIDLLNVSFDGSSAPDRISAKAGVKELRRIAPWRRWKLVEIDADLSKLTYETEHVMSLITPANTYMDLNIGMALWLSAGGSGWVCEEVGNTNNDHLPRLRYQSNARILLIGSGADEQCAGYGRHRTKYKQSGWHGLHEEMKFDMQRIWKRNLGRDDRCLSDRGKEARFPFLDEDVIDVLLDLPLWSIADLNQPSGVGDKKILREVALLLGLQEASMQPKRAIQFGSRIARESNRKNYGSNRAANHASAGSAVIQR